MTGTFDDWTKSEKLDKVGEHFEKNVQLSDASKKIYYKVRRSYILAGPSYPFRNLPFSQFRNFLISSCHPHPYRMHRREEARDPVVIRNHRRQCDGSIGSL